jgi:hypothetical protein
MQAPSGFHEAFFIPVLSISKERDVRNIGKRLLVKHVCRV